MKEQIKYVKEDVTKQYEIIPFEDYEGYVFIDDTVVDASGNLDDFNKEINGFCDHPPRLVYAADELRLKFNVDEIIGYNLIGHPGGAYERIDPDQIDRLKNTLKEWAYHQGVISFAPNYKKLIIFPAKEDNDFEITKEKSKTIESYDILFDESFANITLNSKWKTLTLYSEYFEEALFFPDDKSTFIDYLCNQNLGEILYKFLGFTTDIDDIIYIEKIWNLFIQHIKAGGEEGQQ